MLFLNRLFMSEIKNQILNWVQKNLGPDFVFRENQLTTIEKLIDDKINNNIYHHIIEAPTGSGKSFINIVCAGVLWEYYKRKSYILCSDLYLYSQYIDIINKYNLNDFGYLKGATGNYVCSKLSCDLREAPCKMANVSYAKLFGLYYNKKSMCGDKCTDAEFNKLKKLFPCVSTCKYIAERIDAVNAPITLMTYQLFYYQMNIADCKYDSHGNIIAGQFDYRDYIFCDEAHNIPSIMQQRCKPTITYDDMKKMMIIYNYYKSLKKDPTKLSIFKKMPDVSDVETKFKTYWAKMLDNKLNAFENTYLLINFTRKLVDTICIIAKRIQNIFATKIKSGYILTPYERTIYSNICWVQNYHCYLDDFCRAIELSGPKYTYKQIQSGSIVNFGCVNESGIICCFLLKFAKKGTTMTSATFGDKKSFVENCGYDFLNKLSFTLGQYDSCETDGNVEIISIDSTFDFTKSPIYIDNEYKMTYSNKSHMIYNIVNKINNILNTHEHENGIIHTGNYENAKNIYTLIDAKHRHRILIYKNSAEKSKLIKQIKNDTNYVLIGPSLCEGIDLPDDLCRFIVIMKMPYMSLGDKYVTSKMKLYKKWYNNVTMNNVIQGIGRGNRSKHDYCTTYIIDGAFKRLYSYTKSNWPNYITKRFVNVA